MTAADDVCYLTASEAQERFRNADLSPVELVTALIDRAAAVEPKVNALTYSFPERALEQAAAAEQHYRAGTARPLEGLPVMLKDGHDVAGEITTYGSRLYADHRPEQSSLHIERLLKAGAIMLARTTTPEFGAATICHSELWGVTRNPWDLSQSPAGSGGGAGAALATGMVPLADGSDYGGSIRNPASACGVVGYKPPHGRIPGRPPWALHGWSTFGPLARSVADCALMMNVMAGEHLADPTSLPGHKKLPTQFEPISDWRIAFSPDLGFFQVDPDVARNARQAAERFKDMGCVVEDVELPWTDEVFRAALAQYHAYNDLDLEAMSEEERDLLSDHMAKDSQYFEGKGMTSLWRSLEVRGEMYEALADIFRRCRVLICPTLATPSVDAELHPTDGKVEINGQTVDPTLGWTLCYPFNMLCKLPAISMPSGFADKGVPTGLQIVGRPHDDLSVFRAASAFEAACPGFVAQGRFPALA